MTTHNHEKLYDKEIAPLLLKVAEKCNKHGLPFIAVVEFDTDRCGFTNSKHGKNNLMFVMLRHVFHAKNNFDALVFGLIKYFRQEKINISNSLVAKMLMELIK